MAKSDDDLETLVTSSSPQESSAMKGDIAQESTPPVQESTLTEMPEEELTDGSETTYKHTVAGCHIPKSMSLPLQDMVPDPFPNLTPYTPLTPSGTKEPPSSPTLPHSRRISAPVESPKKRVKETYIHRRFSQQEFTSSQNSQHKMLNVVKTMLKFYKEDQTYRSMSIESTMLASDVCSLLVLANGAKDDKNWAIVEHSSRFNLERSLEDHEPILHTYRSWGHMEENRFYFRKDFRKYELFQTTLAGFPVHMVGTRDMRKETKEEREERRNSQFLKSLVDGEDNAPDIQGHMVLREGKKSWKKHYFVLRKSGLYYSTKGTSKESRHLVLLSSLSDVNIYTAQQSKKTLGAPNNYCIVLKPKYCISNVNELKCLCADDEQARTCWLTALRLVKYGQQLLDNCQAMTRRQDKLRSIENQGPLLTGKKLTRVSSDFGSLRGRAVADPGETIGVTYSEGSILQKKVFRTQKSPRTSERRSPVPSIESSSPRLIHRSYPGLAHDLHLHQPWYYGSISREDAVNLITECGLVDGVFLVRKSNTIVGTDVLSLAHNHKVKHCQIHKIEECGQWYYTLDGGQTKFMDLLKLVDFYQLNASVLPTKLTCYISQLSGGEMHHGTY